MSKLLSWEKTRVPWEREVSIWERMALAENYSQVGIWLDTEGFPLDRETLVRVKQELEDLPEPLAKGLPETVRLIRRQLRGESQVGAPEVPLLEQLSLAAKIQAHWAGLLKPLQGLQGLGGFAPGAREIQTWLLEQDAPDWPVPGGWVHRGADEQLSVELAI